jgi:hypothetical protein
MESVNGGGVGVRVARGMKRHPKGGAGPVRQEEQSCGAGELGESPKSFGEETDRRTNKVRHIRLKNLGEKIRIGGR